MDKIVFSGKSGQLEKVDVLLPEDIPHPQNLGPGKTQTTEIYGKPVTPDDASDVMSAAQARGEDTGKGSVSAHMQSAAAANVRRGVVPAEMKEASKGGKPMGPLDTSKVTMQTEHAAKHPVHYAAPEK
eukprot:TRINITY_DN887_c0_g1_i1.p1 TRINITY_DN887_c0_g1~~TRINITY_DN887_c0_g1_i1.p1  ORF type:complete len:128 (-),score=28.05 TRINITY_DN887_c0_g1_i1:874-1257(-)